MYENKVKRNFFVIFGTLCIFAITMYAVAAHNTVYAADSNNWETESNSYFDYADVISTNATYYGNMEDRPGFGFDNDYYRFTTDKDGYIELTFNHDYASNTSSYYQVSLMTSGERKIKEKIIKANEEKVVFEKVGLDADTYYILVSNMRTTASNGNNYWFNVKFTESDRWESVVKSENAISVNETYYGNSAWSYGLGYDTDTYWFTTPTDGYVTLNFNHEYIHDPDEYWKVSILDSNEKTILSQYVRGNVKSVKFPRVGLDEGTYYVEVDTVHLPYSDVTYNFKVNFSSNLKLSLSAAKYSYTGKERNPKVTVKYSGTPLTEGTHYTVSYSNNKYPGTATVTVKGIGEYIGTFKKNFTINSPAATPKSVTVNLYGYDDLQVKWNGQKVSGHTVKYKVQYKKYGGNWATLSSKTTKTSLKKANLTDGTRYAFKITPYVTINGKNYFASAKSTSYVYTLKKVSVPKISKADKRYVKVKWTNISGESGYQIYRSKYKTKKFSKVKTVGSKYSSAKIKTSRNKTYYYKVRAYKKVGDKYIYGPWSSVKAYKLK